MYDRRIATLEVWSKMAARCIIFPMTVLLFAIIFSGQPSWCVSIREQHSTGGVRRGHTPDIGVDTAMGSGRMGGYSSSSSSSSSYSFNKNIPVGNHKGGRHLKLYGVEVPVFKFRGEDAELKCNYDRGIDPLYSVKWYKDDNEFYRYLFKMNKPRMVFDTAGVKVDLHRSNDRRVLLKDLEFNSTGMYKCEVSADSPHFHTYDNQSAMVVVELPERGPNIKGGKGHYHVGEIARLNCTSSRSKPAAKLTWFINGQEVDGKAHLIQYFPWIHRDGLESRRLGLTFRVDESHFLKGELVLKCEATVAAIYTAFEEEDATVSGDDPVILEQRADYVRARSEAPVVLPTATLGLVLVILMAEQAVT